MFLHYLRSFVVFFSSFIDCLSLESGDFYREKIKKNKKNRGASPHTPPRMPGAFCLNAGLRGTMTVDLPSIDSFLSACEYTSPIHSTVPAPNTLLCVRWTPACILRLSHTYGCHIPGTKTLRPGPVNCAWCDKEELQHTSSLIPDHRTPIHSSGEIALSPSFWYISAHMHNFCILETIVVSPCTLETMW